MKVNYTNLSGRINVDIEADTQIEIFEQLAHFQEIFDESVCGKCGSENVRFQVRTVEDNLYYELRCMDCGAKLSFGVMKKEDYSLDEKIRKVIGLMTEDGSNGILIHKRKNNKSMEKKSPSRESRAFFM